MLVDRVAKWMQIHGPDRLEAACDVFCLRGLEAGWDMVQAAVVVMFYTLHELGALIGAFEDLLVVLRLVVDLCSDYFNGAIYSPPPPANTFFGAGLP